MNILHIYKDYYPVLGGIENHIRVIAEAQAAAGHQVTVLVCSPGLRTHREEVNGVHVIKAGRLFTVASMPISLSQPLALSCLRPDLIHVHSPYPLGEVSGWLICRAVPIVITYHSDVVRQRGWLRLYGPLLRHVLRRVDHIITDSGRYLETSSWLQPVREKCTVIPLGVDLHHFVSPPAPFDGPPTLLFVGKLRYYKGLDTLLNSLKDLPDVHLNLVGDGPMRNSWESLALKLGIDTRVHFLGEVDDANLPTLYQRAHLFVLPANSRAEAFGTVLLEAMASGLPCVTTEIGTGTSWVVQDGVTGIVVPPRNSAALAETIRSLLKDPVRRQAMGHASRQRVTSEFDKSLMIARIEQVYRNVLDSSCQAKLR